MMGPKKLPPGKALLASTSSTSSPAHQSQMGSFPQSKPFEESVKDLSTQQMLQNTLKGQDEIKKQLQDLKEELREMNHQTTWNEQRIGVLEERAVGIRDEMKTIQRGNTEFGHQMLKMEFERMSFFLRFQNLPEAENEDLKEIMTTIIAEYINSDKQQLWWDIDLIYRANSAYARIHNIPRKIHIKFLRKTTRDEVLGAQREGPLKYKDKEITILKQIPKKVRDNRRKYSFLAKKLCNNVVWFKWLFPEGMLIFWEGNRIRIHTPVEAEAFAKKHAALLGEMGDVTQKTKEGGAEAQRVDGREDTTVRRLRSQK